MGGSRYLLCGHGNVPDRLDHVIESLGRMLSPSCLTL